MLQGCLLLAPELFAAHELDCAGSLASRPKSCERRRRLTNCGDQTHDLYMPMPSLARRLNSRDDLRRPGMALNFSSVAVMRLDLPRGYARIRSRPQ